MIGSLMDQPLWKHQELTIHKFRDSNCGAIFHEAGTGKTRTAIEIMRYIFQKNMQYYKTLVLCPQVVIENWRREILQYTKLDHEKVVALKGSITQRIKTINAFGTFMGEQYNLERNQNSMTQFRLYITNYDVLVYEKFLDKLLDVGFDYIIFDESHRMKNVKSKTSKACYKLARKAKYRFLLTGTPLLNSSMDIFSQFKVMDLGKTFGTRLGVFRSEYFHDKNAGMPRESYFPNWVPRPDSYKRLSEKINPLTSVVKKEQCLDLPPLVRKTVYVELEPDQKRAYIEMKHNYVTYLKGGACVAELAMTKALRMLQICSGYMPLEDYSGKRYRHKFKKNPRMEALEVLLEDITPAHKVLVWAVFHENYEDIRTVCGKVGVKYTELHGGVKNAQEQIDLFTNDDSYRVLIGHPGSGGIGVNLVPASYSIYFSRNFSLEYDLQSEARNYRGGSERHEKITRIDIVAPKTLDEFVVERLAEKQNISVEVLESAAREGLL